MSTLSPCRISIKRIQNALDVIDPVFLNTPQFVSEPLSDALGASVIVKIETLNPVRCFKGRGADLFVSGLSAGAAFVTASAGNLGQALAFSARRRGARATVFAAETASPLKIERMRALGADVILEGRDFDAAKKTARKYAERMGLPMIEDGVEPTLSEGAGTIALELLRGGMWPDVILVALGNGAILGGMARAVKAIRPEVKVIGLAAEGAPCMARSFHEGRPVETETIDTIADGMGTRVPVPEALNDLLRDADDVITVSDARMIEGMRLAHRHLGLVLEASGAAGLAALAANPDQFAGRRVATVLCGGNLTEDQMRVWLI